MQDQATSWGLGSAGLVLVLFDLLKVTKGYIDVSVLHCTSRSPEFVSSLPIGDVDAVHVGHKAPRGVYV